MDFIVTKFDAFYEGKLLDVANGRLEQQASSRYFPSDKRFEDVTVKVKIFC